MDLFKALDPDPLYKLKCKRIRDTAQIISLMATKNIPKIYIYFLYNPSFIKKIYKTRFLIILNWPK